MMPRDESMEFTQNNEKNKEKWFLTNQSKDLAKPADLLEMYIWRSREALGSSWNLIHYSSSRKLIGFPTEGLNYMTQVSAPWFCLVFDPLTQTNTPTPEEYTQLQLFF